MMKEMEMEMPTDEGIYSPEELDAKMQVLMEAKAIEDDTELFTAIKDHAMKTHQKIGEMFSQGENKAPKKIKSMADLKARANAQK